MTNPEIEIDELKSKKEKLDLVASQLKKEFIGIDEVIDKIIHSISSWYLLPRLQEKPLVINLWGLTGVGKSSLINRLTDLLDFNNRYYRYDMGELNTDSFQLKKEMQMLFYKNSNNPTILAFDEFQHLRTIDENNIEKNSPVSRIIWEIIDAGRFKSIVFSGYDVDKAMIFISKLKLAINKGLKGSNGIVTTGYAIYKKELLDEYDENLSVLDELGICEKSESSFAIIPHRVAWDLYDCFCIEFSTFSEFRSHLMLLDEIETVCFLEKQLELMLKPIEFDCSKSLIFIMGNLDEAYEMASNYNTDIDADTFHNESLKININHIKKALKTRFRNEQIARLGNNHIIYPAFNKDSFTKLINLELAKIQSFCKKQIDVDIYFDESVITFAYEEGVFPTQGARPVYTTIQQMITSQIGNIVIAGKFSAPEFQKIWFSVEKNTMTCRYISELSESITYSYDLPTNLKQIRKNPCDDLQALVAVHESGHAVTSMLLLNIVPNCICSQSSNTGNDGFVLTDLDGLIINIQSAKAYLAVLMGGIVAEKLMFGADMVTGGSSRDLMEATEKASSFIRKSALGSQIGYYSPESHHSQNHLYDTDYSLNQEIKQWLANAYELALETLTKNKSLLVYLSNHLSDQRIIEKPEIETIYNEYLKSIGNKTPHIIFNTSYRNKLKMMDTESNVGNQTQYWQLNIQKNKNI